MDLKKRKDKWFEVDNSEQPIPDWMPKTINGRKRVWGKIILHYPIRYLVPAADNGHNPRLDPYSESNRKALKPKLEKFGLTEVLPVTPFSKANNGMVIYEMLSGDKRLITERESGSKYMDIRVYEGDEKELDPLRLIYNMKHDLSDAEVAIYLYEKLYKVHNMTYDQIAKECSISNKTYSRHWVSHMCSIAENCIPEVLDAWRSGSIKKMHALYIAKKMSRQDREKQLTALTLSKEGIKVKKLESLIRSGVISQEYRNDENADAKANDEIIRQPRQYSPKTMYEIIRRYEELKKIGTQLKKSQKAVLKEYRWILGEEK